MKLHIQSTQVVDREELRTLLIDSLDELVGSNAQILESKLPWEGHPILVADAKQRPVLISFDPCNAQAALLGGLQAAEQISHALPWINQVYDALHSQQHPPRLVVISQQTPPGAASILAACPDLTLFSYKVLRVNDDMGLWLEAIGVEQGELSNGATQTTGDRPEPTIVGDAPPTRTADTLPSLSDEETRYFRQL